MAYRVFIGSSSDDLRRMYIPTVKEALFRLSEFPVSAIDTGDVTRSDDERLAAAYRLIDSCDVFIGLYGADYGAVPAEKNQSFAELIYHHAHERNVRCLIYMPESTRETIADERQAAFVQHLSEHHIIHYFADTDDLAAQVKMGMHAFNETRHLKVKRIRPEPEVRFGNIDPPAPPAPERKRVVPDDLEAWVDEALGFAADDLQTIMLRSLEIHNAQHQTRDTPNDGWLSVTPIFGEPARRTQFQSDVFMIMPFRERYTQVYENVIRPVVGNLNLTIKRGDDFSSVSGSIMQEVWAALHGCKLVIAETTEINANVYYELGIAHTLGKPAILLTQETDLEARPFDIRHLRFVQYNDSIAGGEKLETDLRNAIIWTLNDLDEKNSNT